jgi:hypothetical protein
VFHGWGFRAISGIALDKSAQFALAFFRREQSVFSADCASESTRKLCDAEQTNHTTAANEDSEGRRRCHLPSQKFFGVVSWIGSLPNTGLW